MARRMQQLATADLPEATFSRQRRVERIDPDAITINHWQARTVNKRMFHHESCRHHRHHFHLSLLARLGAVTM